MKGGFLERGDRDLEYIRVSEKKNSFYGGIWWDLVG
jgi:hypothetical protein